MAPAGLSRIGCNACRHSIMRVFCGLANVSLPPPKAQLVPNILQPQRRLLSFTSLVQSPSIQPSGAKVEAIVEDGSVSERKDDFMPDNELATQEADEIPEASQSDSSLPWYLQHQKVGSPENCPIRDSQLLPPVPKDAPPILLPIMNYLFETAGLDNIALLDLRYLTPPPALGANLIMLLGTARSVKHLNVSADRFCRWLRSNYKLQPFADGLLGRNELKIKLRRRAKRAKLAASVGRQLDDTNRDDGITTGWVCVNVGAVPRTEEEEVSTETVVEEDDAGFIGFGVRDLSPKLVVQMFTEGKRAELDLEGLWNHWQSRRDARSGKLAEEVEARMMEDARMNLEDNKPDNAFESMNPTPDGLKEFRPIG